ncbi:phosphatidylinositol-binding clathrin assembly protein-like [Schistocerca nitens]|uniref:phosphatidylinositol-binding clathrin assembly protein-like n=1 Tax=Schistocerca nitens TaxID=7011 RepID=UPI002117791F|nr:phosphatidylinositol-binding clathrin assembly protein-like [Schistocerca nitens]
MSDEAFLEMLTLVQDVLDALLNFGCSADDLSNGIIVMAVNLLFRDLIRLFVFYNEGVINLLRRYFDMRKKQCENALTLYKNFLVRLEWIPDFIKFCETAGLSSGSVCDLRHVPDSLLDALEQHLSSLEAGKPQNGRAFELWQQTRLAANKILVHNTTCDLSLSSFQPSSGNELCKVTFKEPERSCKLDASRKLDFIYDDPIKLIRNPFVSVELLATKPAISPADVCTNYAPVTASSYAPPPFVSDEDFTAAFRQTENCNASHATRNVNAVSDIRQENFSNVENNFSFDRRGSIANPQANFPRNTSGWSPQHLTSKNSPGYLPMCASMSNKLAAFHM